MTTDSTLEANKDLVSRLYDEIDQHNIDAFDEYFADDLTTGIYRSGSEEQISGTEDLKDLWREYWAAFPDLHGEETELIAEGDRVAIFRTEGGTHKGEFRGIAPTGKEFTFEYSGYVVIEDDQIVHAHFRGNILNLLKQLGVEIPLAQ